MRKIDQPRSREGTKTDAKEERIFMYFFFSLFSLFFASSRLRGFPIFTLAILASWRAWRELNARKYNTQAQNWQNEANAMLGAVGVEHRI